MSFSNRDKQILRDLAKQVADIAAHPYNAERREMWKRHNRLEKVKPMVLVFPEGAWRELLPHTVLRCEDQSARELEWHLRHLIYRWEHLRDDNVIEPWIKIGLDYRTTGWGLEPRRIPSTVAEGSWGFDPVLKDFSDIKKLRFPELVIDEESTQRRFEDVSDAIGDILEVKIHHRIWIDTSLVYELAMLRGLDQLMWDMVDNPGWLHEVMSFMTEGTNRLLDQVEAYDKLDLNNTDDYVGSGGVGYTDELPSPGFTGKVRLIDLWGSANAQELAVVSPEMHEEFVLQYQRRLLSRFGLNCYACCESVTDRLNFVKQIPRLRRISISPWADVRIAAEELQDDYIFSWKPNPAQLCGHFDPESIRKGIRETISIAKDCVLEIIMKDTHTVENDPSRLWTWVRIAQEETQAG
jgi:hypothetical protein